MFANIIMDITKFFDGTYDSSGIITDPLDVMIPEGRRESKIEAISKAERHLQEGTVAVTITFRDVELNMYKETFLCDMVRRVFKTTRGVYRYCMVNDYSQLGRFHLHGSISVKCASVIETLRKKFYKQFGKSKVKLIDNSPKWASYCLEQFTIKGKNNVKVSPLRFISIDSQEY